MSEFDYERRIQQKREEQPFIGQTDLVYALLLEDILLHYRLPGSKINQDELAGLMGVSRSPVRDAINQLVDKRFLIKRSQNGYFIYILTPKDCLYLIEYRTAIERQAVVLAVNRATAHDLNRLRRNQKEMTECGPADWQRMLDLDTEFHDLLVCCSKNDYLIRAYRAFTDQYRFLRNASLTTDMHTNIVLRHRNILLALEAKNEELADEAVRIHLKNNLEDSIVAQDYKYD